MKKFAIGNKGMLLGADGEFHYALSEHDEEMLFDTEEEAETHKPHGACYVQQVG